MSTVNPVMDPAFVQELRRRFPDVQDLRWNDAVQRWELISLSAANRPVSQFWGWFYDPFTKAKIEPDPVTGLVPFRDLWHPSERAELLANLETGYRFRQGADGSNWKEHVRNRSQWNDAERKKRLKARAENFAYMIQQCDLRRPWRKFHEHRPGQGRIIIS